MIKCDKCDKHAEWQENRQTYMAYRCDEHKPVEDPYRITWGICMDNKIPTEEDD